MFDFTDLMAMMTIEDVREDYEREREREEKR